MRKWFITVATILVVLIIGYGCNSEPESPYVPNDEPERPLIILERPSEDDSLYESEDLYEDFIDFSEDEVNEPENEITPEDEEASEDEDIEDIIVEAIEPLIEDISEVDTELFELLNSTASRFNAVAVSLAAFDGEHRFLTYQYGYADISERRLVDIDTKFRVASLSKITTVITAMIMVEEGMISLDGDISVYFGFEVRNPNHPDIPITPRMLMQHTSSLLDSEAFLSSRNNPGTSTTSMQDLLEMRSSFSRREPGGGHRYSNFGITVLGAALELASSKPLDTLARELLFEPLGIDAAYLPINLRDTDNIAAIYNANRGLSRSVAAQLNIGTSGILGHDHHLAQGNLTISALDYARILAMLANDGVLGEVRILSEESVNEIHRADVAAGAFMQGLVVRFQGSVFMGENIFWHTGSMHGEFTQFVYCPETNRGIVVLTTGTAGERLPNGMVRACTTLAEHVWTYLELRVES
jgi:CubicO group peptidase (beta-lactamase class C family)